MIGEGRNFVTRMLGLAQNHAHAEAPSDQFGRLTLLMTWLTLSSICSMAVPRMAHIT